MILVRMKRLPRTKLSGKIVYLTSQLMGPLPIMGELSSPPRRRTSLLMTMILSGRM
jgi:hypothetical protein